MVKVKAPAACHELPDGKPVCGYFQFPGPVHARILDHSPVHQPADDVGCLGVDFVKFIGRIWAQVHWLLVESLGDLHDILSVGAHDPVLGFHDGQLVLEATCHTAKVDARCLLKLLNSLHDQLDLNGQGLVLLLVHAVLEHSVDENGHAMLQAIDCPLLGQPLLLPFVLQMDSGLLFGHPLQLLLELGFIHFPPMAVPLPAQLRIGHVGLEFLYFLLPLFVPGFLALHVLLVKHELVDAFLEQLVHS